jgi:hypothetical protein
MAPQWLELYRATDFRNLDALCDWLQASEIKGIGNLKVYFRPTWRSKIFPTDFLHRPAILRGKLPLEL